MIALKFENRGILRPRIK
jgi:hypothetical protein